MNGSVFISSTGEGVSQRSDRPVEEYVPRRRLESLKSATESLGFRDTRVTMRLVREGRLKAITIGRRVMITTKSLNEFVEA